VTLWVKRSFYLFSKWPANRYDLIHEENNFLVCRISFIFTWKIGFQPVPVAARSKTRPAAALLPRLWVRIPTEAWMPVSSECCVLSGRSLCDELITRPEESYRRWCVVECDLETSWMRRPWPTGGLSRQKQKKKWLKMGECIRINGSKIN
jgi:hypothetical protein